VSDAQIELLLRLIRADQQYHEKKEAGEPVSRDYRGVEVGPINGVNMRTAQWLCEQGLAEMIDLFGNGRSWIFLGKY
jgi:hypothetical protein